jgi:hypothetical protein
MKPFNREKFLLYMLAGIFTWQAAIFTYGVVGCFQKGGKEACPDLGDRYENTVNVMVATTLALLGAGAVASATQRKPSASDRDESLASQAPSQGQASSPPSPLPSQPPVQPPAEGQTFEGRKKKDPKP